MHDTLVQLESKRLLSGCEALASMMRQRVE